MSQHCKQPDRSQQTGDKTGSHIKFIPNHRSIRAVVMCKLQL